MKKHFNWITTILIVVTLICTFGCKVEAEIPKDTTPPAEVTELTVQAANGNAVLNWKNPADTDFAGVQVAMSPAEGTLKNAVILGKDVTSLDVSGLTVGKEYTFTVKTFDESLNYSEGAEEKATVADTSDKTAPAEVTELTVQAANGNAVLNWKNPADTDFAGVQIAMSPAEGTLKNAVILGKEVTSLDVSGLENGKKYTFTVKAFDKSLNYSEGAEEKATVADTADYTAPAEVTELTVTASNGNAVLNWKNPADTDFAGVQVAMSPAEGTLKNAVILGKDVVSFDVSGLENGKEYTFTVKTFDESLNYSEGAEAKATVADTSDKTAPADVTSLTVTASNGNAVLNWKNPADTDFAGVQISMSPAEGTLKNAVILGKDVVSFDVSGLTIGKEYTLTVKTFDESLNYSEGAETKATVADTSDKTAPADVTELTVTASNGNAVLNWKNPADTDFAGVQVAMSPAEGTLKNAVILGKEVTSLDVSGLTVGKEYTFTVKTFDESLNYSEGTEAKATVADTSDYTAPADVTELTVQAANGNAVLAWKNPADADFAGVQVAMTPAEGTLKNAVILGKDVTSLDVSGLTVGNEYTFTVKTFDESLNYSEGTEAKATVADTADYTAPAEVTSLTVTNKDASVLLTWIDATDEDIYGYEVTYEATSFLSRLFAMEEDSIMVAPGSEGCYISNLTNGKEYVFTVKSVDTSGNKSTGVSKTITPSIIEKSALQITLEPNTTEKTNKDVVITVNATTDSASKIKKITYVEGTESKIDTVLAGTNITDIRQITATENTTFTVAVTDTAGRRELAFITVSNIDKTAPSQVTNTEVTYFGALNKFMLSWTNPSDKDFAGIVITYGKKDSEETTTIELSNDITSYEIENIPDDDSEYTISLKTKDDVENFGEAEIVTLVASKRATISGVTIPNAGEGYTGELPVTIIGENLIGNVITCNDETFTNITYLSDTKATATIHYDGSNNTITVTSGISSAIGTVKVVAAEKCFSVGDIVFTDGTRIKAEKVQYGIPDSQVSKAFAVITSVSYGGAVGKAVGLERSSSELKWAPSGKGYFTNFTGIQVTGSGSTSSGYTFSGDMDGSDNWEYICSIAPEGTKDAATKYPTFNFALTYGTQAGLTGTEYENGWYVPSAAELYDVYKNRGTVQTSLNAVGGFTLGTSDYWSSSQNASSNNRAYQVYFNDGYVSSNDKDGNNRVFVLQAFNAEQFNNYEYGTPSITSVTVANAGKSYTGELPVTIIGENLKGYVITCSDSTFGNVNYVSDNMIKATVNCNGIVGENTITVTSGISSASGTVKVVATENCFSVGDILLTDGTRIKAQVIPDSRISKAFAVIVSAPYGGGVGKAVGLKRSSSTLKWAPIDTTGYNTKFTGIQSIREGSTSIGYTFTGDIDGSDNWEYICSIDPEGTKDAATNYPAFNFALTYGTTAGLTETEYENGWYVPSVAELCEVYKNKEVIQTSLTKAGGFTLGTSWYWSSSQYAFTNNDAYIVFFDDGGDGIYDKNNDDYVLVLQAFNAEQFN